MKQCVPTKWPRWKPRCLCLQMPLQLSLSWTIGQSLIHHEWRNAENHIPHKLADISCATFALPSLSCELTWSRRMNLVFSSPMERDEFVTCMLVWVPTNFLHESKVCVLGSILGSIQRVPWQDPALRNSKVLKERHRRNNSWRRCILRALDAFQEWVFVVRLVGLYCARVFLMSWPASVCCILFWYILPGEINVILFLCDSGPRSDARDVPMICAPARRCNFHVPTGIAWWAMLKAHSRC